MKKTLLSLTLACLASSSALAGVSPNPTITVTGTSKNDTKAYVGLNWQLGGGMTPALVLGVVNTKVKSNGDTTGANLAFHLNLAGGVAPGKIKLSALDGKNDLQAELGLGYNFMTAKPFVGLGLNAPYVAVGVDGYLTTGLVPYMTLHSLEAFDKPTQTTNYTCPPGYELSGLSCINP